MTNGTGLCTLVPLFIYLPNSQCSFSFTIQNKLNGHVCMSRMRTMLNNTIHNRELVIKWGIGVRGIGSIIEAVSNKETMVLFWVAFLRTGFLGSKIFRRNVCQRNCCLEKLGVLQYWSFLVDYLFGCKLTYTALKLIISHFFYNRWYLLVSKIWAEGNIETILAVWKI